MSSQTFYLIIQDGFYVNFQGHMTRESPVFLLARRRRQGLAAK